jgi:alpha-beta hydrolase superfamily lysophospholipase
MNLVNQIVPSGVTVYAFDHRGHGRSAEKMVAHINSFDEYRGDVRAFVQMVTAAEANKPLFLMGHSIGGLIVTNYVLHYPDGLRGAIISAPPVGEVDVSPVLRAVGKVMSVLKPDFAIGNGLDATGISRDPAAVAAYVNDPLVHDKVSARWSTEFFAAIDWTRAHAADFKLPVLMIHGDADSFVPIAGSRAFFAQIPQEDKTYITYEGGYHESLNDLHHAQAAADIKKWIIDRV